MKCWLCIVLCVNCFVILSMDNSMKSHREKKIEKCTIISKECNEMLEYTVSSKARAFLNKNEMNVLIKGFQKQLNEGKINIQPFEDLAINFVIKLLIKKHFPTIIVETSVAQDILHEILSSVAICCNNYEGVGNEKNEFIPRDPRIALLHIQTILQSLKKQNQEWKTSLQKVRTLIKKQKKELENESSDLPQTRKNITQNDSTNIFGTAFLKKIGLPFYNKYNGVVTALYLLAVGRRENV